jgi:hypothetical protein
MAKTKKTTTAKSSTSALPVADQRLLREAIYEIDSIFESIDQIGRELNDAEGVYIKLRTNTTRGVLLSGALMGVICESNDTRKLESIDRLREMID